MTKYGFIGLGIMGKGMAANLVKAGFDVTVWNRDQAKCESLVQLGAKQVASAKEVASQCDITFAILSDPEAALEVALGPDGVTEGIQKGAGYIDMSTIDAETSKTIGETIEAAGGRFLEAPVSGTKKPAEDGTLIILAAGDKSLYEEAVPAFQKMGKMHPYLGETGQGAAMKLIVNMIMGSMMTAFCEGLSLGEKSGLDGEQILEVLSAGALANPMFAGKGPFILKQDFPTSFPLKHMQKDMRLAVDMGDKLQQPLSTAAAANETFKKARKLGFSDEDFTAVFKAIK